MSNRKLTLPILLLLLLSLHAQADSLNCITNVGSSYYDLSPLASTTDYTITDIDDTNSTNFIIMKFNVCRFMTTQCHGKFAFASLFSNNTAITDCIDSSATTKFNYVTSTLLDASKPDNGIRMLFENGDPISSTIDGWSPLSADVRNANPDATFSFQVNFKCNESATDAWVESWSLDSRNFTYIVNLHSNNACALLTLDQLSEFISDNPIPFTVVGSVLGFLIMILGLKLYLPTLGLFAFGAGFLVTGLTFFSAIVTPDSRESTKWILLAFCIVFGLALGYIVIIVNKLGIFIMGAWFGFVFALILYNAVLYKIHSNPDLVFLLSCGIGALLFGIISLVFYKHVIIISTSLVGSYLLVRSLSIVIGGFPNEIKLVSSLLAQDYSVTVKWQFYVYMNVILALTIISIVIQYKIKKRTERKAKEFDDDDMEFQKLDI